MDHDEATARLLDTAEELFYQRGIQAVGMAEIRSVSGISLKRLYQCFPAKDQLVEAYLRRRDTRWRACLARHVAEHPPGEPALLAVFDWLHRWFGEPGFRGCAFLNSFGELGATSERTASAVRSHRSRLRCYLLELVEPLAVADPSTLTDQLLALIDGATASAAVTGDPASARTARSAARTLIRAVATDRQPSADGQH